MYPACPVHIYVNYSNTEQLARGTRTLADTTILSIQGHRFNAAQ